ncbi:MAG: GDP-mannose 4,6-dehydratase [Candidatus Omnitrophota bacterium]
MKKRILIFGVDGFSGSHLWNYLKTVEKNEIVGTYNKKLDAFKKNTLKGCLLFQCDINDYSRIKEVLSKVSADEIYFLCSVVTVARSFEMAPSIYETNVLGVSKFLEAVIKTSPRSKILLTGSAEEYGKVSPKDLPIRESQSLAPVSPYGISKMIQEKLVERYRKNYQLRINTTRTFHFSGPWQSNAFVVSDFASQIAQIELGLRKPIIYVGNLKAKRDFSDIRDVVGAYYCIMKKANMGEAFNVCSGRSVAIEDILKRLLSKTNAKISVLKDPQKMRKLDIPDFCGDNRKLKRRTGWKPEISLDQTLDDVLNWWQQYFKKKQKGNHG